jgi:anti-sigma B factor antagonist
MSRPGRTFTIETEDEPNVQVISVAGEADLTAVPHLEQALRIASDKAKVVIVDLTETTFIDSPTIGVLVNWTERMRDAEGRLTIICTNSDLLRIFRQMGLDQTLQIVDSRPPAAS